jgi:signal transduction histidine kinase
LAVIEQSNIQARAKLPALLAALPVAAARIAIGVGVVVLAGWSFQRENLKRLLPGLAAMNPATAVLFVLAGIALILSVRRNPARQVARFLAAIIVAAAVAELLEFAGLWHSVVDEFLFRSQLDAPGNGLPNRMAPNTVFNFLLVGAALLTLGSRGKLLSLSQALAIVVGFGAILPITGYAYGISSFTGLASFVPMGPYTAALFLLLGGGLFFAVPDAPLAQIFAMNDARGALARRLFPLAILSTLFLGWLCMWGERHALYDKVFGTALFAVVLSIIFAFLVRSTVWTFGKLEAERAAVLAHLHDLNRRKDEMIAVVSHDLCSPLAGISLVIELLRRGKTEDTAELLDLMDQSTRRMTSMVRGLLDLAKLQFEELALEGEDLLVSDVIRRSMEPLAISARAKHIALQFHAESQEPLLHADPLRLAQIFNNLLSNAVKFTASGGSIDVTLDALPDGVRVTVRDTGLGIPKNDLPHIFDKYYQAATKATGGEIGGGLGLAIVREAVLAHGGRIDVTSELNQGTAFIVYLPSKNGGKPQPSSSVAEELSVMAHVAQAGVATG